VKVEAWLVLKSTRSSWGATYGSGPYKGQTQVAGIKVARVTQSKPALSENEVATKIEFDVDEGWFLDGSATIKAAIPAPPQGTTEIQATVDMPVRGRAKSPAASVIQP
jgi:hypothetical protein